MPNNPLGEQDLQMIKDSLSALDDVEELANRSETAGIDVTQQKADIKRERDRLLKLKQGFFPGQ